MLANLPGFATPESTILKWIGGKYPCSKYLQETPKWDIFAYCEFLVYILNIICKQNCMQSQQEQPEDVEDNHLEDTGHNHVPEVMGPAPYRY